MNFSGNANSVSLFITLQLLLHKIIKTLSDNVVLTDV